MACRNHIMFDHLPIGTTDENWFQDDQPIFTISPETRRKHVAIFGATGAGKSTLLRNMIAWDISAGAGVTVVDPHGQLVDDILNHHLPSSRTGDVIYFDPKDPDRAIPLNLLDSPSHDLDGLVVDNVMGIFKQLWPDAFAVGARMEDIFRNSFYKIAALSRYDTPEPDRVAHPLYVEEAQNFIGDFESIFAETRKYGLPLTIAMQGIESLSADDASAVFTNCGTVISFRVSGKDALRLAQEFGLELAASSLQDLPDFAFYVRTLKPLQRKDRQSASPIAPHLVNAYAPFAPPSRHAARERVIRTSAERWTRPRPELEAKLVRFLKRGFNARGRYKKTAG